MLKVFLEKNIASAVELINEYGFEQEKVYRQLKHSQRDSLMNFINFLVLFAQYILRWFTQMIKKLTTYNNKDFESAFKLYTTRQGNADAMASLGYLYQNAGV